MGVLDLFKEGGFIMWPLLVCSIAIWWVAFEKFLSLSKFTKEYQRLADRAEELAKNNKLEEIRGLYGPANSLISAPHIALIDELDSSKELREDKVGRRLSETQAGLKKFLWVLGTIGTTAPFIGLFGTVVGIIKAFQRISETGKSGFSVVAGDLSEALVATAAGIIVAVIAVMFYNYFSTRIKEIALQFKNRLEDLADSMQKN